MEPNGKFDLEELIKLRQEIHKNADISCNEYKTRDRIKKYLVSKGVTEESMTMVADTGMYVDIVGRGAAQGDDRKIAFRADMDALETSEDNFDLEYRSVTNGAHLCGHDGHVVGLLGGVSLFVEHLDQIPKNKSIRLLFQPAEEKVGGAKRMVEEGCLKGVQEVWGLHNIPEDPIDEICVKPGVLCAGVEFCKITVTGKGGHSSMKKDLIDPIYPACKLIVKMEEYLETLGEDVNNVNIIASLLKIETKAPNIIPDTCVVNGTCRYFDSKLKDDYFDYLMKVIMIIEMEHKVQIDIEIGNYPPVINNEDLVNELKKIVPFINQENLPKKFSEDFSEFSNVVPGCFFLYKISNKRNTLLHRPNYDFNDDCIFKISHLWKKIMYHRLYI
jgi:amidohydrolase